MCVNKWAHIFCSSATSPQVNMSVVQLELKSLFCARRLFYLGFWLQQSIYFTFEANTFCFYLVKSRALLSFSDQRLMRRRRSRDPLICLYWTLNWVQHHTEAFIYKSKCFNTYKNNRKDDTRTHTHYQDTDVTIQVESYRDRGRDLYGVSSAASLSPSAPVAETSGGEEFPVILCSGLKRKNSLHVKQTARSLTQSVHDTRRPPGVCLILLHRCTRPPSVHPSDVVLFVRLWDQTPCGETHTSHQGPEHTNDTP